MLKFTGGAILTAVVVAAGLTVPAKADVIYDLTFENSANTIVGTGVLDLNLASVSQADNLNESISSIFSSLTTTNLDGTGTYTITSANLIGGSSYIQTGTAGQIYTLTVPETEPPSDATGATNILFLDLYTSGWQLHGQYDSTKYSGPLLVGSPQLSTIDPPAPVPEPMTLSLFGAGLAGVAVVRRRKKAKQT